MYCTGTVYTRILYCAVLPNGVLRGTVPFTVPLSRRCSKIYTDIYGSFHFKFQSSLKILCTVLHAYEYRTPNSVLLLAAGSFRLRLLSGAKVNSGYTSYVAYTDWMRSALKSCSKISLGVRTIPFAQLFAYYTCDS